MFWVLLFDFLVDAIHPWVLDLAEINYGRFRCVPPDKLFQKPSGNTLFLEFTAGLHIVNIKIGLAGGGFPHIVEI